MRYARRTLALVGAALFWIVGCGGNDSGPTPVSSVTFGQPSPAQGSVVTTTGTLPGAFIPKDSGRLSIPLTVTSGRDVPWAQLYLYLYFGTGPNDYCGQNLPDAPTWGPFSKGQTVSVTITGFQVFRLPCAVTSVRAMLHTRNTGLLTPPISSETVAEASLPVNYTIR